ncbi:type VI secretion system contractile sheath large subunit [Nitrincola iocasae]|uniref:Type VI secretion system contractile sheath large subunit n=1 Tax=Nitrincola iocasae TaxID=2614693 RepID=A0A5J6LB29_9GAMM|nr:type VI secretion system contractile sheath large subunit [Nitrincola iocasae]QEW05710.1 type VI secretion system contractile sheath large subunit [Nitrincola iocasae]
MSGRDAAAQTERLNAMAGRVAVSRWIADIDEQISQLLHEILVHPDFQALKSGWYGLRYLVEATSTTSVSVRMLDVSYAELLKDFDFSIEFDQSNLFHKIYSQEFGTAGGTPYGVILCDHRVNLDQPASLNTYISYLQHLAQIGAAAFCPFMLGAPPALLDLENYDQLSGRINLDTTYRQLKFLKWNRFRSHPDARFIGMALPGVLIDTPVHLQSDSGFMVSEVLATRCADSFTWMSPVYSLGRTLTHCYEATGWLAEICGVKAHGATVNDNASGFSSLVDAFPCLQTEKLVHDELSQSLADYGFISLTSTTNSAKTVVYTTPSLHNPPSYDDTAVQHNARYAAQLQYVLCVSRFSHYLKILMRDKVGSFTSVDECQAYLKSWLLNYVMSTSDASEHLLAKYPLREAQVSVFELPGQAGVFKCVVRLTPHYQLECVETELLFSTDVVNNG